RRASGGGAVAPRGGGIPALALAPSGIVAPALRPCRLSGPVLPDAGGAALVLPCGGPAALRGAPRGLRGGARIDAAPAEHRAVPGLPLGGLGARQALGAHAPALELGSDRLAPSLAERSERGLVERPGVAQALEHAAVRIAVVGRLLDRSRGGRAAGGRAPAAGRR